jgi:predicted DNA-binding antitoxin AbrB/MazE fold protein
MTVVLEAMFDGEVFRPVAPVDLPINTRVRVMVEKPSTASFLDVAEALKLEGPSDWSVRVDDYLQSELPA